MTLLLALGGCMEPPLPQRGPLANDYVVDPEAPRIIALDIEPVHGEPSSATREIRVVSFPTAVDTPRIEVCGHLNGAAFIEDFNCFSNEEEVEVIGTGDTILWTPPDLFDPREQMCGNTYENPFMACWAQFPVRAVSDHAQTGTYALLPRTVDGLVPEDDDIPYIEDASLELTIDIVDGVAHLEATTSSVFDNFAWWTTGGVFVQTGRTGPVEVRNGRATTLNTLELPSDRNEIEIAVVATDLESYEERTKEVTWARATLSY